LIILSRELKKLMQSIDVKYNSEKSLY